MSATLTQPIRVIEPVGRAVDGRAAALTNGRYTIGSSPDSDICVNASGVAPQHCTLTVTNDQILLTAVSRHTWLNDCPILDGEQLRAGDRIALGPVVMRLRNAHPNEFAHEPLEEPTIPTTAETSAAIPPAATETLAIGTQDTVHRATLADAGQPTPASDVGPAIDNPANAATSISESISSLLGDSPLFRDSGNRSDDLRSAILARHVQLIGDKQRDLTTQILELELRAAEFEEEIADRERSLASQHLELVGDTRQFDRTRQQFDALAAEAEEIQTQRNEIAAQWALLEAAQREFDQKQAESQTGPSDLEQQRAELQAELQQLEQQRQQLDLESERIAQQRHLVIEASDQLASLQEREATLLERELDLDSRIQQADMKTAAASVPALAPESDDAAGERDELARQRAELDQRSSQLQHDRRVHQQHCEASASELEQRRDELARLEDAYAEKRSKLDTDLQRLQDEQRQLQEKAQQLATARQEARQPRAAPAGNPRRTRDANCQPGRAGGRTGSSVSRFARPDPKAHRR